MFPASGTIQRGSKVVIVSDDFALGSQNFQGKIGKVLATQEAGAPRRPSPAQRYLVRFAPEIIEGRCVTIATWFNGAEVRLAGDEAAVQKAAEATYPPMTVREVA